MLSNHCFKQPTILFSKAGIFRQVLGIPRLAVGNCFSGIHAHLSQRTKGRDTLIQENCFFYQIVQGQHMVCRTSLWEKYSFVIHLHKKNCSDCFFPLFSVFPTLGELFICLADINPGFGRKTGKGISIRANIWTNFDEDLLMSDWGFLGNELSWHMIQSQFYNSEISGHHASI